MRESFISALTPFSHLKHCSKRPITFLTLQRQDACSARIKLQWGVRKSLNLFWKHPYVRSTFCRCFWVIWASFSVLFCVLHRHFKGHKEVLPLLLLNFSTRKEFTSFSSFSLYFCDSPMRKNFLNFRHFCCCSFLCGMKFSTSLAQ